MTEALGLLFRGKVLDLVPNTRLKLGFGAGMELELGPGPRRIAAVIEVDKRGRARVVDVGGANASGVWVRGLRRLEHALVVGDVLTIERARVLVVGLISPELRTEQRNPLIWQTIVACSSPSFTQLEDMAMASSSQAPVWIGGESGTGKELAARAIHLAGPRAEGPFIAVNCAALPDSLIESELFGAEKGAFTGATKSRAGAFSQAHGGTLLLDEVGELPLGAQAKLLRVLETREVQPVGSARTIKVDVRVLCASWRDLEAEVVAMRFRHDLLHRLWVLRIELPPLRERPADIAPLLEVMLEREAASHLFPDPAMLAVLEKHSWPGNIRELRNCVSRAVAGDDPTLLLPHPPRRAKHGSHAKAPGVGVSELIRSTLHHHRGNRVRSARALGVSRSTLYRWLDSLAASESTTTSGVGPGRVDRRGATFMMAQALAKKA